MFAVFNYKHFSMYFISLKFIEWPRWLVFFFILFGFCISSLKSEIFFINQSGSITTSDTINPSKFSPIIDTFNNYKNNPIEHNQDNFIIFNIGDKDSSKRNTDEIPKNFHKQLLNQTTVNYCNFDPNLLSEKRSTKAATKYFDSKEKESVDIIVRGDIYNSTTKFGIRIKFENKQAESVQLWYLLEAKSVCSNRVVGTWYLSQQSNTETIYCFNRDDTVFGHRSDQSVTVFDQVWLPTETYEDIYFVLAVFTDEAYTTLNPYYSVISSPIIRYETHISISDYDIKCAMTRNFNPTEIFHLENENEKNEENATSVTSSSFSTPTKVESTTSGMLETRSVSTTTQNASFESLSNLDKDRSIFISILGTIPSCGELNDNLTSNVKNQVTRFWLNTLQDFLSTSQKIGSFELNEAFVINQNGSKISLNNSCSVLNYLQVCENKGICQEDLNSKPRCVCPSKSNEESYYWSGNYCDVRISSSSNSDQIKMYTTIGVLATFAIVSLLALIVYVIYKRRKQKEIIKRFPSLINNKNNIECISNGVYDGSKMMVKRHQILDLAFNSMTEEYNLSMDVSSLDFTMSDQNQMKVYDKRHSFSARNFNGSLVPGASSSSTVSSDIYGSDEKKQLIKPVNKNLICVTDGASTSFKIIKNSEKLKTNNAILKGSIKTNIKNKCASFSKKHFSADESAKVLSEKSKTSSNNNKTPTSSNNIDFPRPNSNPNSHLKPNAYTRDVIISSQPTKCHFKGYFGNDRKKKLKESSKKTDALKSKPGQPMKVEVPIELNLNSHVNFAYDNEILFDAMKPGELKSHIIAEKTAMNPYFAKNNIDNEYFQSSSQTHSDDFLIESQLQNFQLGRRESAQHIPQSFERQMAKNFQNLTTNSSPTDSYSLDTSIETSNQNSKYTDSTSICTDHSLKDEDAWLPILNIAEEEILKYQAEEARGTEFCLI